jgi:hypothetical protein
MTSRDLLALEQRATALVRYDEENEGDKVPGPQATRKLVGGSDSDN